MQLISVQTIFIPDYIRGWAILLIINIILILSQTYGQRMFYGDISHRAISISDSWVAIVSRDVHIWAESTPAVPHLIRRLLLDM